MYKYAALLLSLWIYSKSEFNCKIRKIAFAAFVRINSHNEIGFSGNKSCNACDTAYYTWKSNNAEFENIFSRIEQELTDVADIINMNWVNRDFI